MWLNNLFNRTPQPTNIPLFDEGFLRRLERLSFRTAPYLRGVAAGERRSRYLRPALDFSDHRPYTPGDDLRHVDWNAYSRHEELFVKLGEAPQSVNVHILLDSSPSMAWAGNGGHSLKWVSARRLAGALGYLALSGGERLEIASFAGGLGQHFGPTQGKKQAVPLLKFLAGIPPSSKESGHSGLVQSLETYARRHPRGGLLVLISDLLNTVTAPDGSSDGEELAEALRFFSAPRWQVMILHLLTAQELDPQIEGDFDLRDVETGDSLPFHFDQTTLSKYRLRVRAWCAQLQSAAGRRAASYTRLVAEWPLEKAVIPYLRQRGAVQ